MRTTTATIVLAATWNAIILQCGYAEETNALAGHWHSAAVESEQAADKDGEEFDCEFLAGRLTTKRGDEVSRLRYSVNENASPKQIDVTSDEPEDANLVWKGIYRFQGGSLQICTRLGPRENTQRPTTFETKKGDPALKLYLLTRIRK